jgi:hypothetical protein
MSSPLYTNRLNKKLCGVTRVNGRVYFKYSRSIVVGQHSRHSGCPPSNPCHVCQKMAAPCETKMSCMSAALWHQLIYPWNVPDEGHYHWMRMCHATGYSELRIINYSSIIHGMESKLQPFQWAWNVSVTGYLSVIYYIKSSGSSIFCRPVYLVVATRPYNVKWMRWYIHGSFSARNA